MCVDLARRLRPLARLPHSLSLVRSGRRAVMANFVYSPERITSVNFGVRSGLPSVLAITALLPKSGVSHCTNKFVQRLAFLCSGATPPHSALVSFISWREVVRFCDARTRAPNVGTQCGHSMRAPNVGTQCRHPMRAPNAGTQCRHPM